MQRGLFLFFFSFSFFPLRQTFSSGQRVSVFPNQRCLLLVGVCVVMVSHKSNYEDWLVILVIFLLCPPPPPPPNKPSSCKAVQSGYLLSSVVDTAASTPPPPPIAHNGTNCYIAVQSLYHLLCSYYDKYASKHTHTRTHARTPQATKTTSEICDS